MAEPTYVVLESQPERTKPPHRKENPIIKTLIERILAARDLAAELEPDIRIKEFLEAMHISPCGDGVDPSCATIDTHSRCWCRNFTAECVKEMRGQSPDELAVTVAGWVQGASNNGLLSISNPPIAKWVNEETVPPYIEPDPLSRRSVTTYTFDRGVSGTGKPTGLEGKGNREQGMPHAEPPPINRRSVTTYTFDRGGGLVGKPIG